MCSSTVWPGKQVMTGVLIQRGTLASRQLNSRLQMLNEFVGNWPQVWNSWTVFQPVQSALSSLHTMSHIMAEYSDKKANKSSTLLEGNYPIFGQ
jgi:hypothetical protein